MIELLKTIDKFGHDFEHGPRVFAFDPAPLLHGVLVDHRIFSICFHSVKVFLVMPTGLFTEGYNVHNRKMLYLLLPNSLQAYQDESPDYPIVSSLSTTLPGFALDGTT